MAALLTLLILIALALRFLVPGLLTSLAAPLWSLGGPLTQKVGELVPYQSRAALLKERDGYARETEALRNENAALGARITDLERLLGGRTQGVPGILAGVLARPPVSPYDVLIVDQGALAGVRVGSHAFGPGGVPVGIVTETNPRTSRVTLYSETGRVTEGWAGAARIPMKLTGTGAGGFDAEIPGTAGTTVGDQVFVPGPGALPIGSVVQIITDPSSPSVELHIRPYVNPFSLTWVTLEAL